jgi:uncharacterized protein Yka (UPF0111/DUF47 family)
MDRERFEDLEAQVVNLVEAFARIKEENQRLRQHVKQLQETLRSQQQELEHVRPDQEELTHLRMVLQTFQQERDVIRQKLEQMLSTIAWLEGHARMDEGIRA